MGIVQSLLARLPQWDSLTWVAILLAGLALTRATVTYTWKEGAEKKSVLELVDSGLIALVLVFFIIRPFIVQAFYIPSGSMEPTLYGSDRGGDRILVCKWIYRFREPKRQEIVVFSAPPVADPAVKNGINKDFIKRLIGLPGDKVEVKNSHVWVNDRILDEPYIPKNRQANYHMKIVDGNVYSDDGAYGERFVIDKLKNSPAGRIPPGKYLVLGDNRMNSNDSHKWGLLDRDRVLGRAMFIFWPPNRFGLLDGTTASSTPARDVHVAERAPAN